MKGFQKKYTTEIVPELKKKLGVKNNLQVPRVTKVTVNVGVGRFLKDAAYVTAVEESLAVICGQKPVKTRAKKSIASFKIRQGMVIGYMATLRGKHMYDFLEKLVSFTLPRIRDFRGLDRRAIDRAGNLSIGFREHLSFPETKSDDIERVHGLEVTITTTAHDRQKGEALFEALGFPFKK